MSWLNKILGKDGVSQAVVKAASTAAVATDEALVVAISPNNSVALAGSVAHDAVATGVNPTLVGGYASAAAPADVSADGDATRMWLLRSGAQVVQPALAGTLASTAAAGVQKVGIVGNAGAAVDVVAGAAAPANVIYSAGRCATANPTNEANGDAVPIMTDKAGRLVVQPGHIRELIAVQTTNIAASTAETTIVTSGGAGVFCDISCLIITSTDAAAATITIKDATAGTTRMVLDYPDAGLAPPSPLIIPFPIPMPQAAAANNWTATVSVNAGSVKITAVFVKNL